MGRGTLYAAENLPNLISVDFLAQEQKRGGACLIQQGDCDDSGATKCMEGESALGSGGVSWCYGFVSAVDVHELAKRATRDRFKQGNRALRRGILEYAVDVANEFPPTALAAAGTCQARER